MIIAFFGHSDFVKTSELEEKMMITLRSISVDERVELFLGGYGAFDRFALEYAKRKNKRIINVSK